MEKWKKWVYINFSYNLIKNDAQLKQNKNDKQPRKTQSHKFIKNKNHVQKKKSLLNPQKKEKKERKGNLHRPMESKRKKMRTKIFHLL